MRTAIFTLLAVCLISWFGFTLILSGFLEFDEVVKLFPGLQLPTTTSEVGASLNILQGVFSSLAVVLALVAVFIQGKELKESTNAQREQAHALAAQIDLQAEIVAMNAYSARLQFLVAEMDRLENQIENLLREVAGPIDGAEKRRKWDIIRNSRSLHGKYRDDAKAIDQSISVRLNTSSRSRYAET